jgi:hypothetical protein
MGYDMTWRARRRAVKGRTSIWAVEEYAGEGPSATEPLGFVAYDPGLRRGEPALAELATFAAQAGVLLTPRPRSTQRAAGF